MTLLYLCSTMYTMYLSSNRCACPGALSAVRSGIGKATLANRLCLRGIVDTLPREMVVLCKQHDNNYCCSVSHDLGIAN